MADPILDELWRVREELIKKHGGWMAIGNTSRKWIVRTAGVNGLGSSQQLAEREVVVESGHSERGKLEWRQASS